MKNRTLMLAIGLALSACSGSGIKRVVIEESKTRPNWVDDERLSYEQDDRIWFKSRDTVRGDQRLNACFLLAANDNREAMLRAIVDGMRGATDEAQADISENAELVLGKVRSGEWSGKIYGFRDEGQFFQRVQIRDEASGSVTERLDCFVLSSIGKSDYAKTRAEVMNRIVAIDPKIKEAIGNKQADFFKEGRKPSSAPSDAKEQ